MSRPLRSALILVPAAIVVLLLGIWLGGHPNDLPEFMAKAFVADDTRIVSEAIDTVHDNYYREIDPNDLANFAIGGMVGKLDDRFSNYFTPKEYSDFQEQQRSEFTGIGVLVQVDDPPAPTLKQGLRVVKVYDGSPAKRGGVKAGDVILSANGHQLKGLKQDKASSYVTGEPGSAVRIAVRRGDTEKVFALTRATVSVGFTATQLKTYKGQKVGVVSLTQFGSGAHAAVYSSLARLKKQGATRFVFDLRGNGGGLVSEAQLIASAFLKDGPIVTTRGRTVKSQTLRATGEPIVPTAPLVVLVDRGTASASEIVTGALQDRHRAEVVGTHTFGKGVFQEVIKLSNGGALDITAGQYFTPSGRNLGGRGVRTGAGITPNVEASDNPKTKPDEALDAALKTVVGE